MNKAFIFDMDGVIVDSERAWQKYGDHFFSRLVGSKIEEKIGSIIGMTINEEYEKATSYGFSMNKNDFVKAYDKKAAYIYSKASITKGINKLGEKLISLGFKLGLVSSSRKNWIEHVLPRFSFSKSLEQIISVNDRPDLKPKPNPAAYLETIQKLGATPKTTIILEDSNSGIQAGKNAGAFVIGFSQNLVDGYIQKNADVYAKNIEEVIEIVISRISS